MVCSTSHVRRTKTRKIHRNDSIIDKIDLKIEQTNAFCFGTCGGGEPDLVFGNNPFTFTVDADVSGAYLWYSLLASVGSYARLCEVN